MSGQIPFGRFPTRTGCSCGAAGTGKGSSVNRRIGPAAAHLAARISSALQQGSPRAGWECWEQMEPEHECVGNGDSSLASVHAVFGIRHPCKQSHHEHHTSRASVTHANTEQQCATCKAHTCGEKKLCVCVCKHMHRRIAVLFFRDAKLAASCSFATEGCSEHSITQQML